MAAPTGDVFDVWLGEKLQKINPDVDLEVFVTYIRGVLETDEDEEDTDESISGILGEITEERLEDHCVAIRTKWADLNKELMEEKAKKETHNIDQQLASIMEKTSVAVVKQKEQSAEERARKAAILAQYAQVSDGEQSDEEGATGGGGGGGGGDLEKISNAAAVDERQREMRDRSKQESDQKKAKDKEDREKQKQKVVDRKEKEKNRTQKGERRR